jgi:DNA topoisomerase-1
VNDYLRQVCGEGFTAKDFRTWAGTVLVARALADAARPATATDARHAVVQAIESAAQRLGNTVAVCRKSYVHPVVVEGFLEGDVIERARRAPARMRRLSADEVAGVRLIERRTRAARRTAKKVA